MDYFPNSQIRCLKKASLCADNIDTRGRVQNLAKHVDVLFEYSSKPRTLQKVCVGGGWFAVFSCFASV